MYHHITGKLKFITAYQRKGALENFIQKNSISMRNHIIVEYNTSFYLFKKEFKNIEYEGEFLDMYREGKDICFDTTFPCQKKDIDLHIKNQAEDVILLLTK